MKSRHVLSAALTAVLCLASEVVFNVNDDVFAYPQVRSTLHVTETLD